MARPSVAFAAYPANPQIYFAFFPPTDGAGLPASEFAVAETFGFSLFGFLASLFPRFLPLAIVCPSNVQRSGAGLTRVWLR